MSRSRTLLRALVAAASLPALAAAQDGNNTRYVLSIGNHPRVDGIRINFRDHEIDRVRGANITVWSAYRDADLGEVRGLALGLPLTSTGDLTGIGLGAAGITIEGDSRGFAIGGLGAGAGGSLTGFSAGGLGVGAGDEVRGFAIGGLGVGAGGDLHGLAIGGVGVGSGGELVGIAIGGLAVGAGDRIHGGAVGLLGVGSTRIEGVAIGAHVRSEDVVGLVIAPAYFRAHPGADVVGLAVSTVNIVEGRQRGLAIGIVNYAHTLRGVQLGLVNIIRDNPSGRRWLPIVNWGSER